MSSTENLFPSPPGTADPIFSPRTVRKKELEDEAAEHGHEVNGVSDNEGEDADNDDNDDAQSVISQASTVEYEHEPFSTFQHKARTLTASLFNASPEDITVEHIKGGAYNRIIGLTISAPKPKKWTFAWFRALLFRAFCFRTKPTQPKEQKYVLRIPRYENEGYGMDYDIAVLKFACKTLDVPIPELVRFDTSKENVLESPYMIQKRLSGQNLALGEVMENLNTSQMQDLTRQLLSIQQKMLAITSFSGGIISPSAPEEGQGEEDTLTFTTQLDTFPIPPPAKLYGREPPTPLFSPSKPQSTYTFLVSQCNRWIDWEEATDGFSMPHWTSLLLLIEALHDRGFLHTDSKFHLSHSDIFARNILITTPSATTVEITGLLDWDAEWVHFAPFFTAYRAPFWLWISDDNDESEIDERAVFTPSVELQDVEVKKVWEEMAGEEWKSVAMREEYVVARRVWRVLQTGCWSSDMIEEAEGLVEEWLKIYPEDDWRFVALGDSDEDSGGEGEEERTEEESPKKYDRFGHVLQALESHSSSGSSPGWSSASSSDDEDSHAG